MTSRHCGWVRNRLSDPGAKYLLEHDKEAVRAHLDACGECRAFEEVVSRMTGVAAQLEPAPASALEDRRIIHAAMEGRLPGRSLKQKTPVPWIAAAASLLMGIALLAVWRSAPDTTRARGVAASAADIDRKLEETTSTPAPADGPVLESPIAAEVAFDERGVPLTLPAGDRIVGTPGTRLHIEVLTPSAVVLRLQRGKVVARVDGTDRSRTFTVVGRQLAAEVHGTVFSVESAPDTPDRVRVLEGVVKVFDRNLTQAGWMLHDRQEFTFAASAPVVAQKAALRADARLAGLLPVATPGDKAPTPSPEAMDPVDGASPADRLARAARELRSEKRYGEAKTAYEALIAQFGSTTAGRNALVALAQLEFSTLRDPAAAERHFNAYLQADPDGWLADEAWIGLVRIYAENGQHGRVEETTRTYLRRKEGTFAPEMIRRRGDALSAAGNCAAAVEYYRTVIDRWTLSREAGAAANGLAACGARVD